MENVIQRGEKQDVSASRQQLVSDLIDNVKNDLLHWDDAFKRMRRWRNFARGKQWPGMTKSDGADPEARYVANVTLRALKRRTDRTYARNPKFTFERARRLNLKYWDGTAASLQKAALFVESGADQTGYWQKVITEASAANADEAVKQRIGETASILYEYFIREQTPSAKMMMKKQVTASLMNGVSYFKQTFQRVTDYTPEASSRLADHRERLAKLQRLAADAADAEIFDGSSEMEELQLMISDLERTEKIVIREGLAIDYPDSMNIIPDRNMTYLPGFIGCSYVTEQHNLTREKVKEIYKIDLGSDFKSYHVAEDESGNKSEKARVWEIWHKGDNLLYVVCEGYNDFLIEPVSPPTYTERFYPWFVYAPNAIEDQDDPFPPSDVELIMPMQTEINRSGESLRNHRWANRPGHVTGVNIDEEDAAKLQSRAEHEVVVLKGLGEDEDIRRKLQPFPTVPLDPNLYNTSPAFTDMLHASGNQEATLGGTSDATATESSIAESNQQISRTSDVDDLDELLNDMARAGSQILFAEMSAEKVEEIVGPGALWPDMDRDAIAKEIMLQVVAGSSGRPNQAQQIQMRERVYPMLFQIPGLNPEKMARDLIHIMDDSIRYEDWVDTDAPSLTALNGQMQAQANAAGGGANNAPRPPARSTDGPPGAGQEGLG